MKKIERFTGRLYGDIIKNLRSYEEHRDAECLHYIRVDIKKIKAVINLVKENEKKFKAHNQFKPLRAIFREAGDIRQPEVMLQLLLKYGVTNISKDGLLDAGRNFENEFVSHIPEFTKTCKKSRKELIRQARKINHKKIIKSIDNFKRRLQKALTNKIRFELIHKTRKLIKQVLYLSDIHGDIKKRERKFFDELQELIGAVHDKQMLMILLRKPRNQKALVDLNTALKADKKLIIDKCTGFYKVKGIGFI
jgi:CHAD domain-containing protein